MKNKGVVESEPAKEQTENLSGPLIPLSSPHVDLESVGGKALNLSRLAAAGFPVPNAFFILTASYREFLNSNNLIARIKGILAGINTASLNSIKDLERASEEIRARFLKGTIPAGLKTALKNGWNWLGAGPVAVRLSKG